MDDERRQRLMARRRALQAALKLQRLADLARQLAADGFAAEVLPPDACAPALAMLRSVPGRSARIDWRRLPRGMCGPYRNHEERDRLLTDALTWCAGKEPEVIVVWRSYEGGLRLPTEAALARVGWLADQGIDTWFVSAIGSRWLVDCSVFDAVVCHFRVPLWAAT